MRGRGDNIREVDHEIDHAKDRDNHSIIGSIASIGSNGNSASTMRRPDSHQSHHENPSTIDSLPHQHSHPTPDLHHPLNSALPMPLRTTTDAGIRILPPPIPRGDFHGHRVSRPLGHEPHRSLPTIDYSYRPPPLNTQSHYPNQTHRDEYQHVHQPQPRSTLYPSTSDLQRDPPSSSSLMMNREPQHQPPPLHPLSMPPQHYGPAYRPYDAPHGHPMSSGPTFDAHHQHYPGRNASPPPRRQSPAPRSQYPHFLAPAHHLQNHGGVRDQGAEWSASREPRSDPFQPASPSNNISSSQSSGHLTPRDPSESDAHRKSPISLSIRTKRSRLNNVSHLVEQIRSPTSSVSISSTASSAARWAPPPHSTGGEVPTRGAAVPDATVVGATRNPAHNNQHNSSDGHQPEPHSGHGPDSSYTSAAGASESALAAEEQLARRPSTSDAGIAADGRTGGSRPSAVAEDRQWERRMSISKKRSRSESNDAWDSASGDADMHEPLPPRPETGAANTSSASASATTTTRRSSQTGGREGGDDEGDDGDDSKDESSTTAARQKRKVTEKRAQQNRAAQRAFRQRKEHYLRDLETRAQILEDRVKYLEPFELRCRTLSESINSAVRDLDASAREREYWFRQCEEFRGALRRTGSELERLKIKYGEIGSAVTSGNRDSEAPGPSRSFQASADRVYESRRAEEGIDGKGRRDGSNVHAHQAPYPNAHHHPQQPPSARPSDHRLPPSYHPPAPSSMHLAPQSVPRDRSSVDGGSEQRPPPSFSDPATAHPPHGSGSSHHPPAHHPPHGPHHDRSSHPSDATRVSFPPSGPGRLPAGNETIPLPPAPPTRPQYTPYPEPQSRVIPPPHPPAISYSSFGIPASAHPGPASSASQTYGRAPSAISAPPADSGGDGAMLQPHSYPSHQPLGGGGRSYAYSSTPHQGPNTPTPQRQNEMQQVNFDRGYYKAKDVNIDERERHDGRWKDHGEPSSITSAGYNRDGERNKLTSDDGLRRDFRDDDDANDRSGGYADGEGAPRSAHSDSVVASEPRVSERATSPGKRRRQRGKSRRQKDSVEPAQSAASSASCGGSSREHSSSLMHPARSFSSTPAVVTPIPAPAPSSSHIQDIPPPPSSSVSDVHARSSQSQRKGSINRMVLE
ncbi:hypothetical protein DFS34DRAFT_326500 [Phlyctochytrium arcticum]|nr:hypothetical protein DFS34DRAFT_326500 [Phlyctochytrium arcticum]